MCTRCTPYGLFAGCSMGSVTDRPSAIRFLPEKALRYSRFDMNFSSELARQLANLPQIKSELRFRPNNTIYKIGAQYRFIEYTVRGKRRYYTMSALTASPYIGRVLSTASANDGATIAEIMNAIREPAAIRESAIDEADLLDFIDGLIGMQFLVSELDPSVTGPDFFGSLIEKISPLTQAQEIRTGLSSAYACLQHDNTGLANYLQAQEATVRTWAPKRQYRHHPDRPFLGNGRQQPQLSHCPRNKGHSRKNNGIDPPPLHHPNWRNSKRSSPNATRTRPFPYARPSTPIPASVMASPSQAMSRICLC